MCVSSKSSPKSCSLLSAGAAKHLIKENSVSGLVYFVHDIITRGVGNSSQQCQV